MSLSAFSCSLQCVTLGESQPDRLHSMVVFRSRRCDGGDVILEGGLSRRPVGRASAWHHRYSPDGAGSGKAVRRAGIGSRCVGSHSKSVRARLISLERERESEHRLGWVTYLYPPLAIYLPVKPCGGSHLAIASAWRKARYTRSGGAPSTR